MSKAGTPRAKKTVIPDLTAIGYALEKDGPDNQVKDDFETWDIKYSGRMDVLVDNMYVCSFAPVLISIKPNWFFAHQVEFGLSSKRSSTPAVHYEEQVSSPLQITYILRLTLNWNRCSGWPNVKNQETGAVWLPLLYNKGSPDDKTHPGDLNPNKVPLRDIILSFWQQKTGRSVRELYNFWYGAVSEASATSAVSGAYKAMKVTFDHGITIHREGPKDGEVEAFQLMSK